MANSKEAAALAITHIQYSSNSVLFHLINYTRESVIVTTYI